MNISIGPKSEKSVRFWCMCTKQTTMVPSMTYILTKLKPPSKRQLFMYLLVVLYSSLRERFDFLLTLPAWTWTGRCRGHAPVEQLLTMPRCCPQGCNLVLVHQFLWWVSGQSNIKTQEIKSSISKCLDTLLVMASGRLKDTYTGALSLFDWRPDSWKCSKIYSSNNTNTFGMPV